ncbi:MAG: hypothetical protein IJH34_03105 [Romboutsia sp.]|nr:hypothetical protein [Romboutsia sp.]
MKFVTLAELEEIEAKENVTDVEFNGISGQDGASNWYTVYYEDGSEEDVYTVSNIAGCDWLTVKSKLENYITVDKDNIGKDGSCIVDFTNEYADYSISGKIVDNEVVIEDDEKIYMNH